MIALNPEFLTKHGKKEFAVIPYEEFVALQEFLDDAYDLLDPRAAQREDVDTEAVPLHEVKKMLGFD